jgi:hypothetical protein
MRGGLVPRSSSFIGMTAPITALVGAVSFGAIRWDSANTIPSSDRQTLR